VHARVGVLGLGGDQVELLALGCRRPLDQPGVEPLAEVDVPDDVTAAS
jgi:hypothetical protein